MKNDIALIEERNIEDMIYEIRGVQVMFDFDLARLYKCTNGTKDINKAVKRNINRFPEDFYFQLTENEMKNFWFQYGTKKRNETRGGRFKNPHVFTEQGIAMLASVLHTEIAETMSVKIIRTFVKMRNIIQNNIDYFKEICLIENRLIIHDNKIDNIDNNIKLLQESFDKLEEKKKKKICYILMVKYLIHILKLLIY